MPQGDALIFAIVNFSVLPAWVMLLVAPRSTITKAVVHSGLYPIVLATAYAVLLFGDSPGPQGANFLTLEGVTQIFTTPRTIIACWIHYLIFDLFIGAWEVRDAARLKIPHYIAAPSVLLTLLFGPIGLASWLIVRGAMRKRFDVVEDDDDPA